MTEVQIIFAGIAERYFCAKRKLNAKIFNRWEFPMSPQMFPMTCCSIAH